jgi:hypothetical protein
VKLLGEVFCASKLGEQTPMSRARFLLRAQSVAGSCRRMLCLKETSVTVWEEGREWEGQATRPTRGFLRQRQTRSGA